MANQGSLGGIDALLGCPLNLPSFKVGYNLMIIDFVLMNRKELFIFIWSVSSSMG